VKAPSSLFAGPAVEKAHAAIILVHGRGAPAAGMIEIYEALNAPWCAAVAPQAPGHSWYPYSFLAPIEENQPNLDYSLGMIQNIVEDLIGRGIKSDHVALLGFSQGACLCSEFVARHPRRYGAVMALTGGLIGPAGTPRNYQGSLDGTPVFLGASDPDPHVPFGRVQETKEILAAMGAKVELRRYPGMGHTINEDELEACRKLVGAMAPPEKKSNKPLR